MKNFNIPNYNENELLFHNPKLLNNKLNHSLIFKLVDKKYSQSFLNDGIIHLGTASGYRKLETDEQRKGYGDSGEGALNVGYNKEDIQLSFDNIDVTEGTNNISFNSPYIFSMVRIGNIDKISNYSDKYKNKLIAKLNNALLTDFNHPKDIFWITEPAQFFNKIFQRFSGIMSKNFYGKVNDVYYTNNKHKNKKIRKLAAINNLKQFEESYFVKDNFFKNQYEYRLVIFGNYSKSININIGQLSSMVKRINGFKDVLF